MGIDSRDYYSPSRYGGFSFFPPVLKNLLLINITVFFLQMIFEHISFGGVPGWYFFHRYFALNPIVGHDQTGLPYNFQIWQLFTYQFMHGSFTHILFNMFMLWMFGMELENLMGHRKFLLYYLLCGFGAGLLQLLLAPFISDALAPTIGASGAVFGVMIAFAMFFPDRYILLYFLIPIKAKYLIAFLVIIEFMSIGDQSLVAHLAHIGGAITGVIYILLDRKNEFNFNRMFRFLKRGKFNSTFNTTFRKPPVRFKEKNIEEAEFYDINNKRTDEVTQEEIDKILDKISQSGYQNLTEREKRILFEASKKH